MELYERYNLNIIKYGSSVYPLFQTQGHAAQFAIPFAKHYCFGYGYDIGCNKQEWSYPGSVPIDPVINPVYDAFNLPSKNVDYIFSSHCLEHLDNWYDAVSYWYECLKENGGILFLYLPHYSQEYWRPWNNRKHKHVIQPEQISDLMKQLGFKNIFVSGVDLNNSFMIVGEK